MFRPKWYIYITLSPLPKAWEWSWKEKTERLCEVEVVDDYNETKVSIHDKVMSLTMAVTA